MSSIITAAFKATIGLLVNKGRDKAAERFKEGDVTDEKFRGLVVRDIEDIKSKLDGLARRDLLASISFFKEGIELLYDVFQKARSRSERGAITAQEAAGSATSETFSLAKRVNKLELTALDESATRTLDNAKDRFKDARRKATEAFANEALVLSDRVLAMQYRVMATVLETVDNPQDALSACRVCIEELHRLPAVLKSFDVELKKGFLARFNKDERGEIISTVCHVNRVIYDVTQMVACRGEIMMLPFVDTGKERVDPLRDRRIAEILKKQGVEHCFVNQWSFGQKGEEDHKLKDPRGITTNTHGQFIIAENGDKTLKVFDSNGHFSHHFNPQTDDADTKLLETLSNSRRRPGGRPPSAPQPGSRSTSFGGKNKTKQTCRRRVDEAIFLLSLPLSPVRMASLRNTREALLLGYSEGWLDEMEFLALYDLNTSENLEFPYDSYDQFNLDDIDEAECIAEFRFEKRHILQLEEVLQIPALLKCDQRSVFTGTEGLCLLLKRLAYPCRYSDLIYRFGRPVPVLCMITNKVIDYIYDTHHRKITNWNNGILNPVSLQMYADAISAKGAALDNCFGFIDGTVRAISKPGERQRVMYNGHKRIHGIKFQSVTLPNGLIANMYGPVEGRKHDASMLTDSGLLRELQRNAISPTGQPLCVYGDPAYPLRVHLQGPFKNAYLTPQMQQFNKSMSEVRISVEWLFNDIINYFKFMDFKKNLKVGLSSVGKMYIVSGLLRNALTCLYGNSTSKFFDIQPPSLEDYFA